MLNIYLIKKKEGRNLINLSDTLKKIEIIKMLIQFSF